MFFFFKQKTAYEMRISDWSSDVCSSDLRDFPGPGPTRHGSVRCRSDQLFLGELQEILSGIAAGIAVGPAAGMVDRGLLHQRKEQALLQPRCQIGRAACRERVCQYV